MRIYNKVMLYFWMALFVISMVTVTYMGFKEGFERWVFYYTFSAIALLMFFVRKFMMKRMEKHLTFLENQKNKNN